MKVAVIAHSGKSLGGGLDELRRALAAEGVTDPFWREVRKSRKAPAQIAKALKRHVDLVVVWGGDGMVQRCIDALAGCDVEIAIVPAGTANLLATELGIPKSVGGAVKTALHGDLRTLDLGCFRGERFAVMAGVGFDAMMIRDAGGGLKHRFGRAAYVWSGSKQLRATPFRATIEADGAPWYKGKATLILIGNVGRLIGGVSVFTGARPDDGKLYLGVVTADGAVEWARMLARAAFGKVATSPFVQTTSASSIKVELSRKVLYELDGGDRKRVKSFKAWLDPAAVKIRVPRA